jgi:hypothetical protein
MWSNHREFAEDWIAAWNSHDLARVMSHYEDDVVLKSPRVRLILDRDDGIIRGKAALRDYMASALARIPDLRFTLDRVFSGINSAVIEFHTTDGRHGAELMEFGATGRVSRVLAHYAVD